MRRPAWMPTYGLSVQAGGLAPNNFTRRTAAGVSGGHTGRFRSRAVYAAGAWRSRRLDDRLEARRARRDEAQVAALAAHQIARDREPDAAAVARGRGEAAFEEAVGTSGRDAGTVVAHAQARPATRDLERHRGRSVAVPERVVDEDIHELAGRLGRQARHHAGV